MEIQNLTTEQLEELLAKRKKSEKKKREKERLVYEKERDIDISRAVSSYLEAEQIVTSKVQEIHRVMSRHAERLKEYGQIRKNSKGGFSITNSEKTQRITRTRSTQPTWDERSQKAVELIQDFLIDTVKKRDTKVFEVLISFIQKNNNGDLEYHRVMDLLAHEDKWDDPRWVEGLKLIKESFSNDFKGYGYEVKIKDSSQKWVAIRITPSI